MTHSVGAGWTVLVAVALAATAIIELTGLPRSRAGAAKRDRGSGLVLRLVIIPAIAVMVLAPQLAPGADIDPPEAGLVAGLVILVAGEAIRIWARVTLGRYFTYEVETSSDQEIIQTGPYRAVRHPSYTGLLLILVGFGVLWGNWVGAAIGALLTLIGLWYRIRVEEEALSVDLGDAYTAYAKTHKRLLPYVW
jgi:protein-S-isoprenylcysteine O-methyltransferase Ste14